MCIKQVTQAVAFFTRFCAFLFLVILLSTLAHADVTSTGNISPALPWNFYTNGKVGYSDNSTGTIEVTGGSSLACGLGYLGYGLNSTGTATVAGRDSKWTNSGDLYVGRSGSGTLKIETGGEVRNSSGYLGGVAGSTGMATVTGADSKWINDLNLFVGLNGSGSLTVADGGVVTADRFYASLSDLHGNGTINANSVVLAADLVFDATHGLQQTIPFGSGGKLNFNYTNYGLNVLGVGYKGSGTLLITGGRTIDSEFGQLGCSSGSTGVANVSGPGSKWNLGDGLYVGNSGNGLLKIEAGGEVCNSLGYLGCVTGSTGAATVTGVGSKWNSGSLWVGDGGSGSLTITNGGLVTASGVSINSKSKVVLDVGTGSQLIGYSELFNIGGSNPITNNGTMRLLAGAGIPAGSPAVQPIVATTWRGTGTYQAVGGKWTSSHTFTVSPVQNGDAGIPVSMDLGSTQRALITSPTGAALGTSFLETTDSQTLTFTASTLKGDKLTSLEQKLDTESSYLLSGWSFTDVSGYTADSPVYLSFDVGIGRDASKLELWKNTTTGWSKFTTDDFVYRDKYASFCVTSLGDYAVAVPEPSTLALLGLAGLALVVARRRLR